jgi:hypothetical protein
MTIAGGHYHTTKCGHTCNQIKKIHISEFLQSNSKQDAIQVDTRIKEITRLVFCVFLWDAHQNNDLS